MTRANDEIVRRFLDGELSSEEERTALHGIADDPESRALLRFDARLRGVLAEEARERGAVPFGFTDRVMAAIEAREAARAGRTHPAAAAGAASGADGTGRLAWLWNELTRPRTLVWRPAYAVATVAAAALALALALGPLRAGFGGAEDRAAGVAPDDRPAEVGSLASAQGAAADEVLVRFVFADGGAESVAVAGDFSRWEPIPLRRRDSNGRTLWTGMVTVPRGEHRYMFVLDGDRWVTDPLATAVRDDGFGNRNAILSL